MLKLFSHVFFNALHWYVTRTFNHHLNIMLPCFGSEFAQCMEFAKLRSIIGVRNATWTQTITQAK